MPHMSSPVIEKLCVMMNISIPVALLVMLCSFDAHAVRVRNCSGLEIEYIKQQFQSGALSEENISYREFKRGSLGITEMCELRNEFASDGLAFTLYKPKDESSNYILVYNGIDGSFKLYGPFIGNYT